MPLVLTFPVPSTCDRPSKRTYNRPQEDIGPFRAELSTHANGSLQGKVTIPTDETISFEALKTLDVDQISTYLAPI